MQEQVSPYECHVFVCTNDRHGERRSCSDGDAQDIRAALKTGIAERGWKPRVRVSQCGCLGVCNAGPNVMIYPQRVWFSGVTTDDVEEIVDVIAEQLGGD